MFGGYRTVSFDGYKSIKVPDTPANRGWLGKQKASNGETGSPALALMALVETGTRALIGAVFGPDADGETGQARGLLSLLDKTMLALMDRGFDGGAFLAAGSNPPSAAGTSTPTENPAQATGSPASPPTSAQTTSQRHADRNP
jgi:hypothetical protein